MLLEKALHFVKSAWLKRAKPCFAGCCFASSPIVTPLLRSAFQTMPSKAMVALENSTQPPSTVVIDFWEVAERYAQTHRCNIEREREKSSLNVVGAIPKPMDEVLRTAIDSRIHDLKQLGVKHIILFTPIIDFDLAGENDKNRNWVLEEILAFWQQTDSGYTITLLHCKWSDDGVLGASAYELKKAGEDLNRIILQLQHGSLQDLLIVSELNENVLTCRVKNPHNVRITGLRIDLYCDNERVDQVYLEPTDIYQKALDRSGIYYVQMHVQCVSGSGYRNSNPVEYFTQEEKDEYSFFLNDADVSEPVLGQETPWLRDMAYPFRDFVLISTRSHAVLQGTDGILQVCPLLKTVTLDKIGEYMNTVLTTATTINIASGKLLFSGIAIFRGQAVEGEASISADLRIDEIMNQRGAYSAVVWDSNALTIVRDYFQAIHLFYYMDDNTTIVSNSYHLLLIAMRKTGVACKLDIDKAASNLAIPGTMILSWNFSNRMDMTNAYQVPLHLDLFLDQNGWRLVPNECGKLIAQETVYHEELYRRQLSEAKTELIELVHAYTGLDNYDGFVTDLTGGFDTRLVFGAIVAQQCNKEVMVQSRITFGELDVEIGSAMNQLYPHAYCCDQITTTMVPVRYDDSCLRSSNMGTCYETGISAGRYKYSSKRIANITGVSGESITRPFKTIRLMNRSEEDLKSAEGLCEFFFDRCTQCTVAAKPFSDMKQLYSEAVMEIPCRTAIAQMECHHLAFSQGYHAPMERSYYLGIPYLVPLQSKKLFGVHLATLDLFRNYKMIFDFQSMMNPKLANLPYDHEEYNVEKSKIYPILIKNEQTVTVNPDTAEWKKAQDARSKNGVSANSPEDLQEIQESISRLPQNMLAALRYNMRELFKKEPALEKLVGIALFHYVQNHSDNRSDMLFLYNKVTSLLDQIRVISDR